MSCSIPKMEITCKVEKYVNIGPVRIFSQLEERAKQQTDKTTDATVNKVDSSNKHK